LFNPGIYEFAVNWVNLAGGGFSDFFIAKKSNNSITNYASFNGKSSIILNKNKALLNNQLNFSIFAWIYLNSYSATQDIYDEGNPINLTFRLNAGMLQISDSNSNNNPIWKNFISTNKIPLHQWTFVGAVLNSSNNGNYFILYQNLNKTIFTGGQDESAPGAHEFGIGGNPGNITNGPQNLNPFNGSIADLQIYNTSLSSYQISQLYDQGIPKTIITNIST
ncbi:MAG: LamG domain-containing protein, partial [Candidatus Marsarchaeota archaeon]|nr:LamG domain-containing protein [Candidatus Marsarchaeota archaeon]